jgi:hypothetical protein
MKVFKTVTPECRIEISYKYLRRLKEKRTIFLGKEDECNERRSSANVSEPKSKQVKMDGLSDAQDTQLQM